MSDLLKEKQQNAARRLARGEKQADVAARIGVCQETLWRWRQLPEFMMEVEREVKENAEVMHHRYAHLVDASVAAIWSELQSGKGSKRVQAALGLLKMLGGERVLAPAMAQPNTLANSERNTASTSSIET